MLDESKIINLAKKTIDTEIAAILEIRKNLDEKFVFACEQLLSCKGRIVVTGIGKSSHIASKIAATLSSTGSPAFFIHPGEAIHGDIGVVTAQDIVIAISNSGNTPEMLALLPSIKHRGNFLIAITGNLNSELAKRADINIDITITKEACPFDLVPTSSTTAALVMGDALAMVLLELKGFTAKDFALSHPGGILGKRLLLKIDDIMHKDSAIPITNKDATLNLALIEMTQKKLGITTVIDENKKLAGVFTDGDLRRALENKIDIHETKINRAMSTNCKTVALGTLAIDALRFMEKHAITALPVVNKEKVLVGIVHMHDILKAGLI